MKVPYRFGLLLTSLVLFVGTAGCQSEESSESRTMMTGGESLEKLDPYSAPLYPAEQEAKANDFEVTLVDGETFSLSEQRGKVIILNIWATWCQPCHEETPDLVDMYNKYRDQGLTVLGVSIDEQKESVVLPFMEDYDVNYPMVIDDGTVMDKYGPTMGVPTSYIIGKEGNLRYFAVGAVTNKELEPRIQELLKE